MRMINTPTSLTAQVRSALGIATGIKAIQLKQVNADSIRFNTGFIENAREKLEAYDPELAAKIIDMYCDARKRDSVFIVVKFSISEEESAVRRAKLKAHTVVQKEKYRIKAAKNTYTKVL
jgi:hypothetical protein